MKFSLIILLFVFSSGLAYSDSNDSATPNTTTDVLVAFELADGIGLLTSIQISDRDAIRLHYTPAYTVSNHGNTEEDQFSHLAINYQRMMARYTNYSLGLVHSSFRNRELIGRRVEGQVLIGEQRARLNLLGLTAQLGFKFENEIGNGVNLVLGLDFGIKQYIQAIKKDVSPWFRSSPAIQADYSDNFDEMPQERKFFGRFYLGTSF